MGWSWYCCIVLLFIFINCVVNKGGEFEKLELVFELYLLFGWVFFCSVMLWVGLFIFWEKRVRKYKYFRLYFDFFSLGMFFFEISIWNKFYLNWIWGIEDWGCWGVIKVKMIIFVLFRFELCENYNF